MAGSPSRLSVDEARGLVDQIAVGYGYMSQSMLDTMPLEVRRVVEEMLRKESKGSELLTELALKLRTSKSRFIYELLQNADHNSYSRVRAKFEAPFIAFRVFRDKVVVECNEDGFTEQDVNAICDVRKRSRGKGYVGVDQAGFKSVFTVAQKVDIESGPFEFYFLHREGDSGMGMVRPIWAGPRTISDQQTPAESRADTVSASLLTRFTLHLRDDGQEGDFTRVRVSIVAQLWDLPATVLLFMKTVQVIKIAVMDNDGKVLRSKEISIMRGLFGAATRLTVKYGDSFAMEASERFFTFCHMAENLPANLNRRRDDKAAETLPDSTAEVVLAFPVDSKDEPLIKSQDVFAFMPLRTAGFKFLIHSDFETQEDRQDIMISSPRNVALRQAILDAFVKAVQRYSLRHALLRKWVRYLPRYANTPSNAFWGELVASMKNAVQNMPLFQANTSRSGRSYRLSALRRLVDSHLDKDGNPLIPDLAEEQYVSQDYDRESLDILVEYGLQYLPIWSMIPRIQALVNGTGWKSRVFDNRDEDWHSRVARLVLRAWEDDSNLWKADIRRMPILPLRSGKVQQPSQHTKLYFPDIDGVQIPEDVGIPMILPAAAANLACRRLYQALGVEVADPPTVRKLITVKHRRPEESDPLNVTNTNNHLRYLYQMHLRDRIEWEEQQTMYVVDHKNRLKRPKQEYVYLPGEGPWSPGDLLLKSVPPGITPPDVSFLHPIYLQDPPSQPLGFDKSWTDWLYHVIWTEDRVQLFSKRDSVTDEEKVFSPEYLFVIDTWPGKVVCRIHMNHQKPDVRTIWEADGIGTNLVRKEKFRCTDGAKHAVETTILPLQSLMVSCKSFLANPHVLPFLPAEEELREEDETAWEAFSKHFGITHTEDLMFYLRILEAIVLGKSTTTESLTNTIVKLYLRIVAQYDSSEEKESVQNQIRSFFSKHSAILSTPQIFFGPHSFLPVRWVSPEQCLWDAPQNSTTTVALRAPWLAVLSTLPPEDRQKLEMFFHDILAVSDMSYHHVVRELEALSTPREGHENNQEIPVLANELYKKLDSLMKGMREADLLDIKIKFSKKPLIYCRHGKGAQWFRVSQCCWSGEGSGASEPCLQPLYPDLAGLFLEHLKVPAVSHRLAFKSIVEEFSSKSDDVACVKRLLWSLNEYLAANHVEESDLTEPLKSRSIFPIKLLGGEVKFLTAADDFSIVDRQLYADAFKDKVKVLDFSIDEVRRLKPLLDWAGLRHRYLSVSVTENTSVDVTQGAKDVALTRSLASKAHALVSIASHFNPSGPASEASFLPSLCEVEAFRSSGLTSTLSLDQDSTEIVVAFGDSGLHLDGERSGHLRVYVPADDELRDISISATLPRALAAYLLGDTISNVTSEAVIVTASVLQAQLTSVGRILEASGIIWLHSSQHADAVPSSAVGRGSTQREPLGPTIASSQVTQPPIVVESADSPYQALLIQTVNQARTARFPSRDSIFNMNLMSQTLQAEGLSRASFRFYAGNQSDWQKMVGAAGELFVFELLSGLRPELPGLSAACWRSTIRHHASWHPQYRSLEKWHGKEQSDIMYNDRSGTLTAHLIDNGYLNEGQRARRPEYSIEVKTTTLNKLDAPFYMSKHQYARMQSTSQDLNKIYIIFRVFGLESGQIGVKVYVNPESARTNGELEFEAPSWTVTARV